MNVFILSKITCRGKISMLIGQIWIEKLMSFFIGGTNSYTNMKHTILHTIVEYFLNRDVKLDGCNLVQF